jgi:putative selenate reductase molybdopterin-binding subunit
MTSTVVAPRRANDVLGQNEIRVEGREKVSGKTKYTADMHAPDMLWAAFTTSPIAHARIVSIDTSEAKRLPGVHAVLTSDDIGPNVRSGRMLYDLPVLAYDKVRYIGDRVAAVAAETREIAEEAARLVMVEYDELPVLLDPFDALAPDAPILHPDLATYFYAGAKPPARKHPNVQGSLLSTKGEADLEPIFAGAHKVFEHSFTTPRQHAGYIEPHAGMVWIDADDVVHVYSVNKQPFAVQNWMSTTLGIPPEKIVVESAAIGGDFGGKGLTTDEYVLYFLARATKRPVKHVYSYVEELQASSVRHPAHLTLKTAVDEHGKFLAHASTVVYDGGAYAAGKPAPSLLPGAGYATVGYQVPNVRLDVTSVYTNTIPGAHIRSPADVQCFFAWEQHVDMMATDLGIDALELRMLNVVRQGETAVTGEHLNQPQGYAVLQTLKTELDAHPAREGGAWGYAVVCRHTGGGKTAVDATLRTDGIVEVICGVPDQGSGAYTAVQRVFAATSGFDLQHILVRGESTSKAKKDPGSGGSRVTYIVGNAAAVAAGLLLGEIKARTGLVFADGSFSAADGTRTLSYADGVAAATKNGPVHVVGEFDGTKHDAEHPADYSFSAFAFDVRVDTGTGAFDVRDALLVADVGTILNPVAHQGQIDGGFVYGWGSSTMEEMPIDESGKLTSLSLGDYKIPSMRDIPPMRTILVAAPGAGGPFGSKMAGELSNSGVAPALVNAVAKAAGVRLSEFPVTAERIYTALQRP